jgi:hypothetical protein
MFQTFWKKNWPHFVAIAVFLLVAVVFCQPSLSGKVLLQSDTQGWKGMAQQSFEYREKFGHFPLWTNSMFGGMPAYQIAMDPTSNIGAVAIWINKVFSFGLPIPISFFFLASLCFYILCVVAGASPWVSMFGALAYAYSTYNPIIVSVGHNTKMNALAYAPMVLAGLLLLYRKKYIVGFAITAFFASTLIGQNHLQIVYYTMLVAGFMAVAHLVNAFREKQVVQSIKASVLGLLAGLIGLATTAGIMLPTFEYAKESMRGGASQLTLDSTEIKTKGGLDKDYALRWSLGPMETFTMMVPGIYGGSNGGNEHGSATKMSEKLTELGVPEESGIGMSNGYSYWGNMSSLNETTSGPPYIGAIICFLFIFSLVYLKSWHKWWVVGVGVLGTLLAWGNSFPGFNHFMLDYMPYLSKFRAPSMAMVIPQMVIPFLAVMGVSQLLDKETDWTLAWKKLRLAGLLTAGVVALLAVFYMSADYTGKGDKQIKESFVQQLGGGAPQANPQADEIANGLMKAMREDRQSLYGKDLLRTILFIVLAFAILFLFAKQKINAMMGALGLAALASIDLIGVDKRYLSHDKFQEDTVLAEGFTRSPADEQILKDPDHGNFRVFNQSGNFTNESVTSYHHNSVGGYHPAKLGLYQDIIVHQLSKGNMGVFNMLNTKYFIGQGPQGQPIAQQNPNAFGNCWLVKGIRYVNSANEEMLALDSSNLKDTAIIHEAYKAAVKAAPVADSTASIKLIQRQNDAIKYETNASTPQFAVLSEVYYKAGWNAYIDGQLTEYAKVNYILRGISVPTGKHTIEFKFEPRSYIVGNQISTWAMILIYVLIAVSIFVFFRQQKNAVATN